MDNKSNCFLPNKEIYFDHPYNKREFKNEKILIHYTNPNERDSSIVNLVNIKPLNLQKLLQKPKPIKNKNYTFSEDFSKISRSGKNNSFQGLTFNANNTDLNSNLNTKSPSKNGSKSKNNIYELKNYHTEKIDETKNKLLKNNSKSPMNKSSNNYAIEKTHKNSNFLKNLNLKLNKTSGNVRNNTSNLLVVNNSSNKDIRKAILKSDSKSFKEEKEYFNNKRNFTPTNDCILEDFAKILQDINNKNNKNLNLKIREIFNNYVEDKKNISNQILLEKENKILKLKIQEYEKKSDSLSKQIKDSKYILKTNKEQIHCLMDKYNQLKKLIKVNIKTDSKSNSVNRVNRGIESKSVSKGIKNNKLSKRSSCAVGLSENENTNNINKSGLLNHKTVNFLKDKNLNTRNNTSHLVHNKIFKSFEMQNKKIRKSTPSKNKFVDNTLDLSKLDTIDLLSRFDVEDPSSIIYFPKRVNTKENMRQIENSKIPKLNITAALQDLEEHELHLQQKEENLKLINYSDDLNNNYISIRDNKIQKQISLNDAFDKDSSFDLDIPTNKGEISLTENNCYNSKHSTNPDTNSKKK